jgi:hypothetical protein
MPLLQLGDTTVITAQRLVFIAHIPIDQIRIQRKIPRRPWSCNWFGSYEHGQVPQIRLYGSLESFGNSSSRIHYFLNNFEEWSF